MKRGDLALRHRRLLNAYAARHQRMPWLKRKARLPRTVHSGWLARLRAWLRG
ncbi:hypothetical protein [Chromobacterium haemolyticum]|uniref:hypothetical protein n=1 Tax=Chromobacterium haemolyticum TaxID=394935 RepID=UPI000A7F1357|nr:hypothetical protein [Chromobacterium haemolyticum]